jgi:phage N-6-adenine-methyltransferase
MGYTMINKGLMSSKTPEWATPQEFFDKLDSEFGFTVDVCANEANAKVDTYYGTLVDGLSQEWRGTCWMNPPYGREISKWMHKAYHSSIDSEATVVCLVPSRTDTAWWHDYAMKGEVRFIRGRLKFGDAKNNAPFPSAVVVFRNKK